MSLIQLLRQLNSALLDSVDKSERLPEQYGVLIDINSAARGHYVQAGDLADLQVAVAHFLNEVGEIL